MVQQAPAIVNGLEKPLRNEMGDLRVALWCGRPGASRHLERVCQEQARCPMFGWDLVWRLYRWWRSEVQLLLKLRQWFRTGGVGFLFNSDSVSLQPDGFSDHGISVALARLTKTWSDRDNEDQTDSVTIKFNGFTVQGNRLAVLIPFSSHSMAFAALRL